MMPISSVSEALSLSLSSCSESNSPSTKYIVCVEGLLLVVLSTPPGGMDDGWMGTTLSGRFDINFDTAPFTIRHVAAATPSAMKIQVNNKVTNMTMNYFDVIICKNF